MGKKCDFFLENQKIFVFSLFSTQNDPKKLILNSEKNWRSGGLRLFSFVAIMSFFHHDISSQIVDMVRTAYAFNAMHLNNQRRTV